MSWLSGSQLTPTSPSPVATPSGPFIASTFADTLRCVSATPFGVAVEPDVYCTNAMSSSSGGASGSIAGASSASIERMRDRSGQLARSASNWGTSAGQVTTALAPEARRMPAVRCR